MTRFKFVTVQCGHKMGMVQNPASVLSNIGSLFFACLKLPLRNQLQHWPASLKESLESSCLIVVIPIYPKCVASGWNRNLSCVPRCFSPGRTMANTWVSFAQFEDARGLEHLQCRDVPRSRISRWEQNHLERTAANGKRWWSINCLGTNLD